MTETAARATEEKQSGWLLAAQSWWRRVAGRAVRDQEGAVIMLAGVLGIASGLGVVLLREGVAFFHSIVFDIPISAHLSDYAAYDWWRVLLVPVLGGLLVGWVSVLIRWWRPHEIVDAIEANALYGGRMSLIDSVNVAITTVLSCGFGAAVGLEAAYTQLGASVCSWIGTRLRLRRDDLRILVGCGAGAAIAAAFNAPLTGAFYAFELVIGSYSLPALAPVTIAALAGTLTARATLGVDPVFTAERPVVLQPTDYPLFVVVGFLCALLSILVMRGVTATEHWFSARSIPRWARPAVGGFVLGTLALIYPQVLGSGHGGIVASLHMEYPLTYLLGLLSARVAASSISIGSGFRGGLFSSSLFLGAMLGSASALLIRLVDPDYSIDPLSFTLVGMGAVGAGIVGAPVAMILLALETTGDLTATAAVMTGVITTSVSVRHWFGYSFATWRFHLRGLKIYGAEDVGWLDQLQVGDFARTDIKSVQATDTIRAARAAYPIGSTKFLIALRGETLAGVVDVAVLHGPELGGEMEDSLIETLLQGEPHHLLPTDNLRQALDRFSETQLEMLPVIEAKNDFRVLGYLTEAYALRRYNQELERHRVKGLSESPLEIHPRDGT